MFKTFFEVLEYAFETSLPYNIWGKVNFAANIKERFRSLKKGC